ncbi:hypothetical protein C5167_004879 [Papaver somniferum]|uniref:Uncharacterized protein n=1 Tax=Papaver somniferum TaxID=3469 RepID=A0A4Y7JBY2_PAPSO|nr:hypothetical protein C5167_004879 [Papaver somniferum]
MLLEFRGHIDITVSGKRFKLKEHHTGMKALYSIVVVRLHEPPAVLLLVTQRSAELISMW